MISDVRERVTSLREIRGEEVSIEELRDALYDGFCESLEIYLDPGDLTEKENEDGEMNAACGPLYGHSPVPVPRKPAHPLFHLPAYKERSTISLAFLRSSMGGDPS